jgi:hypothetical protein
LLALYRLYEQGDVYHAIHIDSGLCSKKSSFPEQDENIPFENPDVSAFSKMKPTSCANYQEDQANQSNAHILLLSIQPKDLLHKAL